MKYLLFTLFLFLPFTKLQSQSTTHKLSVEVSVDETLLNSFNRSGRLFIFLTKNPDLEPRQQIWPNPYSKTHIFAVNKDGFPKDKPLTFGPDLNWTKTTEWGLTNVPEGTYYMQVLWDQDSKESRTGAPGNLYSSKKKIELNSSKHLAVVLNQQIQKRSLKEHPLAKLIELKSDTLSNWWNKEMRIKASILLPHGYQKGKSYPIRYNVAGYGGRYTRLNRLLNNNKFMEWWESDEAPKIINVFLDGEGPFGDSYQMDSDNSGPYGYSLIHEVIPQIESKYRGTDEMTTRFVDGCSTGGWVSLGLQLYYPDIFNGVYSYSPDAIDFENYQLINIYKEKNAFYNEYDYLRPVMRNEYGEPMLSMKEFVAYENVFGPSNTYLDSGGQFSAHTALYSPKGEDGLPQPMFHHVTGEIDSLVAKSWEKYDFKRYAEKNWKTLGPKLQGKIYIWMGDMDHFYLNTGTRGFENFLKNTKDPKSDAIIEFSPMEGHCSLFSHKEILIKIKERLKALE
ncbi:alpha/beta hydrolase-fold protein [Lutimonas zeaxanthinifaciens]|uniref:alpha/beta hydrolase-fold protein n=1 Tax=Lutimonas zeaxanthinifaciens TaxID=3060215 RepID=UPI00265CA356|nr:alpha/beta hydrolase-fold protein [Lutimonas sp. YSD2104]WKK64992.1 alpha/beta hydrolase-fold protein [Lutimonas sp. YSD2104]